MTPPKDQAPGLVARLRRFAIREGYSGVVAANQAADRIERLEAENAELRGKVEKEKEEAWEKGFTAGWENARSCDDNPPNPYLTEQANIRSPVQSEMAKMVDPRKDEK